MALTAACWKGVALMQVSVTAAPTVTSVSSDIYDRSRRVSRAQQNHKNVRLTLCTHYQKLFRKAWQRKRRPPPRSCTANKLLGDRDVTPLRVQSDVTSECTIWLAAVANGISGPTFKNHALTPHAYFDNRKLGPSVEQRRHQKKCCLSDRERFMRDFLLFLYLFVTASCG